MIQATSTLHQMPPGVDSHAHVFTKSLPLAAGRRYAPVNDATLDTYRKLLDEHDIGNAVLVQPSFLGTDNSYLLKALANDRMRLRGVAVVSTDISDTDLINMSSQGVTGVRLNLVGQALPDISTTPYATLWKKLSKIGWHVELHREASNLAPLIRPLLDAGLPVVVDHFGRPDPDQGICDPGFKELLKFGTSGRVWVKVSGVYRCTKPGSNFVTEATDQLINAFGAERMMWGSDWPHTQYERDIDFGQTLSTLLGLNIERSIIDTILRTTPYLFYGFDRDSESANSQSESPSQFIF